MLPTVCAQLILQIQVEFSLRICQALCKNFLCMFAPGPSDAGVPPNAYKSLAYGLHSDLLPSSQIVRRLFARSFPLVWKLALSHLDGDKWLKAFLHGADAYDRIPSACALASDSACLGQYEKSWPVTTLWLMENEEYQICLSMHRASGPFSYWSRC